MSCYGLNIDREKHPIHSDDDSVWISFILRKKNIISFTIKLLQAPKFQQKSSYEIEIIFFNHKQF